MHDTLQRFSIDGYDVAYEERGRGTPMVFVHGSNSDYRTWDAQMDAFAPAYGAITYSRRYHRPNEPIADGVAYAMDEQLDDLVAFVQSIGDEPVHLVGHSYGGYLALLLAMREPQMLRTLTLEQPPVISLFVDVPPKPTQVLRTLATRPRTGIEIVRMAATGFGPAGKAAAKGDVEEATRLFGSAVLGRKFYEGMSPERLQQARDNFIKAEAVSPDFLPLDQEAIQRIEIPVLLVDGAESPRLFHRLADRLQELMPHAERVFVPGASHLAHEDNPALYNQAVLSFLAGH